MFERDETQRRIESIESLVRKIEGVSDPSLRSLSKQLMQSVMDFHGAALTRMLEIVDSAGETGQRIIDEMGGDDLVRSLLLLYGLHPLDLETRVLQALEKTRPYFRSHGGNVELIHLSGAGEVTLRLEGSCRGCPSSAATLQSTVEQAIYDAAPDVTAILVEGAFEEQSPASFLPLSALQKNGNGHAEDQPAGTGKRTDWEDVLGLDGLPQGILRKQEVGGLTVLFCRINENLYAYGVTCPGCGQPLEGGHLEDAILACPVCTQRYDLVHAGRGVDLTTLHLEPIPLLRENGRARIALVSRGQRRPV